MTYVLIRIIIKPSNNKGGEFLKDSELKKLLKNANCIDLHKGKRHDIWYSPITKKKFPVPRHKKEIPTGTCDRILKDAGLK